MSISRAKGLIATQHKDGWRLIPVCFESNLSHTKLWHQRPTWRLCKSDLILPVRELWTVKWLKYRISFSTLRRRRAPGFYLHSHGCKVHKLILRRLWRHPIAVIIFVWLSLSLYTIFTAHGIYKKELPEMWSCSTPLQKVHLRQCVQIFFILPPLSILIKNPYNVLCRKSRLKFI